MLQDRGFVLTHQKVALELSFHGILAGYTEITVSPTTSALRSIFLNARQTKILRVTCNGHDAVYDHLTPPDTLQLTNVHDYPKTKRSIFSNANDTANGELRIQLPQAARPESAAHADATGEEGFAAISVRVDYLVQDTHTAIETVLPSAEAPYRVPHLYTRPIGPDSARHWVPCVDTLWDRCTWELEFVVPRRLETADETIASVSSSPRNLDPLEDQQDVQETLTGTEVYVICSGELTEHAVHPHNPEKSIFYYTQPVATSVQHLAFCAGPFIMGRVSPRRPDAVEVLAFCLPEHEHELLHTTAFTWQAIEYIGGEYGSFPFNSFKMVFVEAARVDCHSSATLAICSSDLLHPPSVIDQAFANRHTLSVAIAFQWVGINIIQKTWADTWLIHGLCQHLAAMFLRRLLGNNDYRFRMKKDCDRLCSWDIGMPPLYQVGLSEPLDPSTLAFVNLKAPLVLYLLDRRLCKMGASLGLGRVIPKVFLQAITGEMANNALGTHQFLRVCKKVSGADLRQFVDQWINGSGCPRFLCTATFNRKKLLIEMHVRQESPAALYAEAHPEDALLSNPVALWEGQMTVRIHEADGTPYEHVLDIKNEHQRYDVPFNTKYKRVRRNTKRFQARQAAAAAAAAGDQDAAEAIGMIDLGFGLGLWEDEEERKRWKVADWTEEDEAIMASAPYEWIRLDADFEWMAHIQFEQPDYMWVSQLQRDRDVVAQLEAVHALSQMPSLITSSMLTRTILVTKYFYRIRAEAAYGLANCALPHLDLLGLFHLLTLFRTTYCFDLPSDSSTPDQTALDAPCIPRPNDFSDWADYFVRRALIHAIARVRDHQGKAHPLVQRFLINLLKYNDNSTNKFVDDFYLASIINALASSLIPADTGMLSARTPGIDDEYSPQEVNLREEAITEVERLQELDRLVPSFHNVVTLATLDFQLALIFANLRPVNLPLFLEYTREGNFTPVRLAALNSLLLLKGLHHKVLTRYYFALLVSDTNHLVKLHLARGMCEALAVAMATNELSFSRIRTGTEANDTLQEASTSAIENLGEQQAKRLQEETHHEAMLKFLRKEIGRSASVREGFLAAMAAAGLEYTPTRSALLHLAQLLFRPHEQSKPPPRPEVATPNPEQSGAQRIKLLIKNAPQAPQAPERQATTRTTPALRVVLPKVPKPKKPKPVEPGKARGMSSSDLTACRNCIQRLMANPHCEPFLRPVDPVRDEAPDYFDVIKDPMDLNSVANKLQSGQYLDRFQFKEDVELIFRNAKTYTPDPKTWIYYEASRSESAFRQLWNRITRTLEQAEARAAAHERSVEDEEDTSRSQPAPSENHSSPDPARRVLKLKANGTASPAAASPSEHEHDTPAALPSPAPTATPAPKRLTLKLSKSKADSKPKRSSTTSDQAAISTPAAADSAAIPAESESTPSEPAPKSAAGPDAALPGEADQPIHPKKCRAVLQTIMKTKEAAIFLQPIDPIRDGAPTYYEEIKHPMDLSTIQRKLQNSEYITMHDFAADMRLMLANCRQFNPPGTLPAQFEAAVRKVWRREWSRAMVRKLEYQDKRALQSMLGRLKQLPSSALFLKPVDPVALGIPHYFDVIPRENARDLSLISEKLRSDQYNSIDALDADIQLMLKNCYTFNAGDEKIVEVTRAFDNAYSQEIHALRLAMGETVAKRKSADPQTTQIAKRSAR